MPTGHKIALFGYGSGSIGRLLCSGLACMEICEPVKKDKAFESAISDLAKVIDSRNYKTLVASYKKVQHKYYPEKDIYKKDK